MLGKQTWFKGTGMLDKQTWFKGTGMLGKIGIFGLHGGSLDITLFIVNFI